MQIYAKQGERNQALKAYNRCIDILEKELGVEPTQKTKDLQAAIRDEYTDVGTQDTQPESMISVDPTPAVAAGLLVPAMTEKPSIVVLPFICLGTVSDVDYFADALTEDIIANLCRYRELYVIAHETTFAYGDSSAGDKSEPNQAKRPGYYPVG
jgi:hypothetical protein